MATAPTVPDFTQYNFELGDTIEVVTKQNGVNAALGQFGGGLQTMCNEIEGDLTVMAGLKSDTQTAAQAAAADALQTAADVVATGQDATATAADRVQTGLDRTATGADAVATGADRVATGQDVIASGQAATAASQSASAAALSETDAQAALDDFLRNYLGRSATPPTTDLAGDPLIIGALYLSTATGDKGMKYWDGATWVEAYTTIAGLGWADITDKPATYPPAAHSHPVGDVTGLGAALDAKRGVADTAFPRYDLDSQVATGAMDLSQCQVFRVGGTVNRTLSFSNPPAINRAMTIVVTLQGSGGTITWPSYILGTAPSLNPTRTIVTVYYDGNQWFFAGTTGY